VLYATNIDFTLGFHSAIAEFFDDDDDDDDDDATIVASELPELL